MGWSGSVELSSMASRQMNAYTMNYDSVIIIIMHSLTHIQPLSTNRTVGLYIFGIRIRIRITLTRLIYHDCLEGYNASPGGTKGEGTRDFRVTLAT